MCMVFFDLSKAFDKIVRELVVGWPNHLPASRDVRVNYLTSMGVSCRAASHNHDYLKENGCLLEQWGVEEPCIVLLRTLHVGSWFSVGQLTSAVKYVLGGRQGCKVGAAMFNGAYDIPLAILNSTLEADGTALKLKRVGDAFSTSPSGTSDKTVTVLDSAFIDDEFIATLALSAEQLAAPIPVMLDRLVNVFANFGLSMTWKPGITECVIRLRGRRSGVFFRELCCDGGRQIVVPGPSPVVHLQIVKISFIQDSESLDSDALHKCRAALGAYSPITYRVFGSDACCAWLKIQLINALINSRLLNCAHFVCPNASYIRRLQSVYMRVLRRMCGESSFERACHTEKFLNS